MGFFRRKRSDAQRRAMFAKLNQKPVIIIQLTPPKTSMEAKQQSQYKLNRDQIYTKLVNASRGSFDYDRGNFNTINDAVKNNNFRTILNEYESIVQQQRRLNKAIPKDKQNKDIAVLKAMFDVAVKNGKQLGWVK